MTAIMVVVQRRKRFISISNLVLISGFAASTYTKLFFKQTISTSQTTLSLSLLLSLSCYFLYTLSRDESYGNNK